MNLSIDIESNTDDNKIKENKEKNQENKKVNSIITIIKEKLTDRYFMQRVNIFTTVCLELYMSLASSFLILFVPQKCGSHVCTLTQNMVLGSPLYNAGLASNFLTMFLMCWMYYLEVKRENKLITYLDVNKNKPCDNTSVELVLKNISETQQNNILNIDKYYQRVAYLVIGWFCINTVLSGIVIYHYYLGNQTISTFITNLFFMVMKLLDVYSTVNTDKNVFYSAYLKSKVQFNDVYPDKYEKVIAYADADAADANANANAGDGIEFVVKSGTVLSDLQKVAHDIKVCVIEMEKIVEEK